MTFSLSILYRFVTAPDSMGMEEKMMQDDMKDDGMHKDTTKAETMHPRDRNVSHSRQRRA